MHLIEAIYSNQGRSRLPRIRISSLLIKFRFINAFAFQKCLSSLDHSKRPEAVCTRVCKNCEFRHVPPPTGHYCDSINNGSAEPFCRHVLFVQCFRYDMIVVLRVSRSLTSVLDRRLMSCQCPMSGLPWKKPPSRGLVSPWDP